jgi:hypothetical protein
MKFWASFILACLGLITAFLAIFEGSVAAVFNFGSKYIEIAGQLDRREPQRLSVPYDPGVQPVATAIQFQITNRLSDGQISERTLVSMGDPHQSVGEFTLTPSHPVGALTITAVSGPGNYRYTLQSEMVVAAANGSRRLICHGEGVIAVRANATFSVNLLSYDPSTTDCVVALN